MSDLEKLLNKNVRDVVNGYSGNVIAVAKYSYNEDLALVCNIDTTGRPVETWLSIERLEVI